MQTLLIVISLSHLRALHDALRKKPFSRSPISKIKLLNSAETSFIRVLISQTVTCIKERIVGNDENIGAGRTREGRMCGGEGVSYVLIHFYTNP